MSYRSLLVFRVHPGQGAEAAAAFLAHGVLTECAAAIPQFVTGEMRRSANDPDRLCVIADWSDPQGWHDWMAHPVRAAQLAALGHFVAEIEHSDVYAAVLR